MSTSPKLRFNHPIKSTTIVKKYKRKISYDIYFRSVIAISSSSSTTTTVTTPPTTPAAVEAHVA